MYRYFGLTGSLVIFLAVLLAMAVYSGRRNEKYSLLNHFISELGEVGVSRGAPLFNVGVIAGGLIFIPFVVGLGLAIDNLWAKLGMVVGLVSAVSLMLVGVFPMNNVAPHRAVAKMFFRCGLVTVVLFSLSILFQPAGREVVPLWVNGLGVLAILSYSSFLLLPVFKQGPLHVSDFFNPEGVLERPPFWLLATLEWLVFFSTIGWFLGVALGLRA